MSFVYHSVTLDKELCIGCTNCVKRCPTEAIRVRGGKAVIIKERCIDCGECIRTCTHRAKKTAVDRLDVIGSYRHAIALPAPALYGQFAGVSDVRQVGAALLKLGFDSVFEVSQAARAVSARTRLLLAQSALPRPLISSACPVVLRLICQRFPELIAHVLPLLPPIELAARMAKRRYSQEYGVRPDDIGAFFISPCAAKSTACRQPLGFAKSEVDGVIAIGEVYPLLLPHIKAPAGEAGSFAGVPGPTGIGWGAAGGEASLLTCDRYLAADGIENVISVLSDLENDRFKTLDFVELGACAGGCVGGVLTIENPFLAKARLQQLHREGGHIHMAGDMDLTDLPFEFELPLEAQNSMLLAGDRARAMELMIKIGEVERSLSGMDCGACGAPSCRAMAEDIVLGNATEDMCIYRLREWYTTWAEAGGSPLQ